MIFWLCVIFLLVSITVCIISNKNYWDGLEIASGVTTTFTGIAVIIMSIFLCIEYTTIDANIAKKEESYKAITYKVESGSCRDEFGLLSKEVIDEVQEWNKNIIYYQNMQDNFWVGIFYPDVYDRFEIIDYERYNSR